MEFRNDFFDSQLEAIQDLYNRLSNENKDDVSLRDVVISWFSEGYAEEFREEYMKNQSLIVQ